jgi:hypothetical protein
MNTALSVMVGLVPTIHVFAPPIAHSVQDVDARHKGAHDELDNRRVRGFQVRPSGAPE